MKVKNSYKYANIDFTGKRFYKLLVLKKPKKGVHGGFVNVIVVIQ